MKTSTELSPDEHVAEPQNCIKEAHDAVPKHLGSSQETMKRDHDLKIFIRAYDKRDLVNVLDTAIIKGQAKKLGYPWKGPGNLVNKFTPTCIG